MWIFIGIVTSFFVLYTPIDSLLYDNERYWYELGEKYTVIDKRYEIGLQNGHMQICDLYIKDWCLRWELLGIKTTKQGTYIYFHIDENKATVRNNGYWSGVTFSFFWLFDERTATSRDNLPEFWILWGLDITLIGKEDLKVWTAETQKILLDLKQDPSIVINGKDYSGSL